jgi:MFS family permease
VHLGAHEGLLGLIASSQSVGVLIMSLPLGLLVERHGPAPVFVVGTLVAGALYGVLPLVAAPGFLLVCTTALGFFMPFRFVSLNTVFLERLLSLGEAKAGWYRGTHMAGMFLIGPMLAAALISRWSFDGTYRWIALSFGVTVLLSPIVFGQHQGVRSEARFGWADLAARLSLVLRDVELRRVCVVEFIAQAINQFYAFFIVVIAVTSLGFGETDAASLVAVQGSSYVFALIALGGVVTRAGSLRVYLTSCSLLAIALVALGTGHTLPLLAFGAVLLGLGLGLLQIVNLTRFARIGARIGRGQIAGMNALVGPAGGFVGSLVGGAVGRSLGLQTVFLLFVPLVLALARQIALHTAEIQPSA